MAQLSLSEFIEQEMEGILEDWEEFAATLPVASHLDSKALRDEAKEILEALVVDMRSEQTAAEQKQKSWSDRPYNAPKLTSYAKTHAWDRYGKGFTLDHMMAEYRALRASIKRRWRQQLESQETPIGWAELDEMERFDEAIDQALIASTDSFTNHLEDGRDLLQGVLAHDLRNPLAAISASAEALLHDETMQPKQLAMAVRVRNGGKRMAAMIDDLLDFTRTRLGRGLPIELSRVDLAAVCHRVADETEASHAEVDFRVEAEGDLHGMWDEERLDQLVGNLLGNAVNHGDTRSPIVLHAEDNGDEVRLTVTNQGRPIPEEQQARIFDPLWRASVGDSARAGLGLGLYICQQIARAHGGEIYLTSSLEEGTTFDVVLPRQTDQGRPMAPMEGGVR